MPSQNIPKFIQNHTKILNQNECFSESARAKCNCTHSKDIANEKYVCAHENIDTYNGFRATPELI